MQSIKTVLNRFNPLEDKYISREYQAFGVHLSEALDDGAHKSLYIKLAKTLPRPVLEEALRFVADSGARRKGALFMWKLKELGILGKKKTEAGLPHEKAVLSDKQAGLPRRSRAKAGEIITTLAIISFVVALVGGLIGVSTGSLSERQKPLSSIAAGGVPCGGSCSRNGDCQRQVTNSAGETIQIACDFSSTPHRCLPATGEIDRCDNVGGICGTTCKNDRDCNHADINDPEILLHCDFSLAGSGRGKCAGFQGGKQCPITPTPTVRPRTTQAPNDQTTQSPTPEPTSSSPQGAQFSTHSLSCGGIFRVIIDPQIVKMTIKGNGGNFVLGDADDVEGSSWRKSPEGYQVWMSYHPGETLDNITVDFSESSIRNRKRAVHVTLKSGGNPNIPGYNQDPIVHLYYYDNVPSFVFDGSSKDIVLDYFVYRNVGRSNETKTYYTQSIRTNGCAAATTPTPIPTATPVPTSTPIPTSTPTPTTRPSATPTPTATPMQTRRPTSTPIPTATPRPTSTPIPTATPIPVCTNKSVYFMIDNSSTQAGNVAMIKQKLDSYFAIHQSDRVNICYDTFSIEAVQGKCANNTINFDIPSSVWTNINDGFKMMSTRRADVKVFLSDGIPSVLDTTFNGTPLKCVYKNLGTKLDGCKPESGSHIKKSIDDCNSTYRGPQSLKNVCTEPYPIGSSNATHSVVVAGGEGSIRANVAAAGGTVYDSLDSFLTKLPDILDITCKRGTAYQQQQQRIQDSIPFSFTVSNASARKTINSVIFQICNVIGTDCVNKEVPVNLQAGENTSEAQAIDIPGRIFSTSGQYVATCELQYNDGTSQLCSEYPVSGSDGIRLDLTAQDESLQSHIKTYAQAANLDGIGDVTAFEYATCVAQLDTVTQGGQNSCDIVADNAITIKDLAVIVENMRKGSR